MSRKALGFTVATILIGVLVALAGVALTGASSATGVVAGSVLGVAIQLVLFWGLFVFAMPGKLVMAHGIGVIVRFATVVGVAFLGVSFGNLPAAPTLFSLVACLFLSTLIEAFFLKSDRMAGGNQAPAVSNA